MRETDNQIRLELDLLPVFDSRSDRAVIDQYVSRFESEVVGFDGPDAAEQIGRVQDSLDALFSRATTQQRADLSSSLLENFETSRSPAIQEVLDRNRSDVLRAYAQGDLSPQAEDTVNTLFQQLSTAQISAPDDFPQLDLIEVNTAVLNRLTLSTTADVQIATVTISADGTRTVVSQPAGFNHQTSSFTSGEDLTQIQRLELEALDAELADWFGRASTGSAESAAISDLRATISDVLSGTIPDQADSVTFVTSRAGDGSLGSASSYAYDGNTRTAILTDNVINPDSLLDLQSRPAGTFVDADASNRIAVLRDISETFPTTRRIISETENPREIAGLNDVFFVQDELLFRQPLEGIAQAQSDLPSRRGDVLIAASADLAAQAAADPRGLSGTLQAEIRELNTRLQSLDVENTTAADLSALGNELGLAVNRARFSSAGDLESNLGPEALALGNLEVSASARNGVTRGDYVIYEQLTDVLDLTDSGVRSRSGSGDDFASVLSNDILDSSLVTAPVDESGQIVRDAASGVYDDPDVINALSAVYDRLDQQDLEVNGFAQGLSQAVSRYATLEEAQVFTNASGADNIRQLRDNSVGSIEAAEGLNGLLPMPDAITAFTRVADDGETIIPDIQIVFSDELLASRSSGELNSILQKVQGDLNAYYDTSTSSRALNLLQDSTPQLVARNLSEFDALSAVPNSNQQLPEDAKVIILLDAGFEGSNGSFAQSIALDSEAGNDRSLGSLAVVQLDADYNSGFQRTNATELYREVFLGSATAFGFAGDFSGENLVAVENQIRGDLDLPLISDSEFGEPVAVRPITDRLGFESEFGQINVNLPEGQIERASLATTRPEFNELGVPLFSLTTDVLGDRVNDLELITGPTSIAQNSDTETIAFRQIVLDEIRNLTSNETPIDDFVQAINRRAAAELSADAADRFQLETVASQLDTTLSFVPGRLVTDAADIPGGQTQLNISLQYAAIGDPQSGYGRFFGPTFLGESLLTVSQTQGIEIARSLSGGADPSPLLASFFTQFVRQGVLSTLSNDAIGVTPDATDRDGFNNVDKRLFALLPRASLEDVVAGVLGNEDIEVLRQATADGTGGLAQQIRDSIEFAAIGREPLLEELNFNGYEERIANIFENVLNARIEAGERFQIAPFEADASTSVLNGRNVTPHTGANGGVSRVPVSITPDGDPVVVVEFRTQSDFVTAAYSDASLFSVDNPDFRDLLKLQFYDSPLAQKLIFEDFVEGYGNTVESVIARTANQSRISEDDASAFFDRAQAVLTNLDSSKRTGTYDGDPISELDQIVVDIESAAGQSFSVGIRDDAATRIETIRSFQPTEATSLELYQTLVANADSSALRGRTGAAEDVRAALDHLGAQDGVSVLAEVQRTLDAAIQRNANGETLFTDPFAEALLLYQATSINNESAVDLSADAIGQSRVDFLIDSVADSGALLRNLEALDALVVGVEDLPRLDPAAIAEQKLALFRAYEQVLDTSGVEVDALSDFGDLDARIRFLVESGAITDPDDISALRAINFDFEQLNALDEDAFADIAISEQQTGILLDEDIAVARAQARLDQFEADVESANTEFEALALEFLNERGIVPASDADQATLVEAIRDSISPFVESGLDEASLETVSQGLSLAAVGDALEDFRNAGRADGLLDALARSQQGESAQGVSGLLDQSGLLINGVDPNQTNADLVLNLNGNGNNNNNGDAVLELRLVQSGTVKSAQLGTADGSPADLLNDLDNTLNFIEAELSDLVFQQLSDDFSVNDGGRVDSVLRSTSGSSDLNLIESTDRILSVATNQLDVESLQGRLLNQEFNRTFGDLFTNTQNLSVREAGSVLLDSVERAGLGQVADIYRDLLTGDNTEINRYLDEFDNPGSAAPDLDNPIWRGLADSPEAQEQILDRIEIWTHLIASCAQQMTGQMVIQRFSVPLG